MSPKALFPPCNKTFKNIILTFQKTPVKNKNVINYIHTYYTCWGWDGSL